MIKQIPKAFFLLLILLLAACSVATETAVSTNVEPEIGDIDVEEAVVEETAVSLEINLPDLGIAPEITNDVWINVDEPITLASQRGKVVLLEFWTFG